MMPLGRTPASVAIVSFVGAWLWLAVASDALAEPLTKPAAIGTSSIFVPDRPAARSLAMENGWLLVQSTQPSSTQAVASDETILAHFELSAREGVEEDVARAYGLELIDRSTLHSLGMRIARYRLPPVATVLERLRADRRIALAVMNVRYAPHHPPPQDAELGVAAKPIGRRLQTPQDERPLASLKHGDNRRTAPKQTTSQDKLANASSRPPRRVDQVAEAPARDSNETRRTRRICGDILGDPA